MNYWWKGLLAVLWHGCVVFILSLLSVSPWWKYVHFKRRFLKTWLITIWRKRIITTFEQIIFSRKNCCFCIFVFHKNCIFHKKIKLYLDKIILNFPLIFMILVLICVSKQEAQRCHKLSTFFSCIKQPLCKNSSITFV